MKTILLFIMALVPIGCSNETANTMHEPSEKLADNVENTNQEQIDDDTDESDNAELDMDESSEETAFEYEELKEMIVKQFESASPTVWAKNIEGVVTEIDTDDKVVALTFDPCDGSPDSYDEDLIDFLIEVKIPSTLFVSAQ